LRNGIINLYKKDTGKKKSVQELMHFDNEPSYSSEDHYIAKEFALALRKQVEELPEKMQQVFVLSRYEHFTIAEISQSLNITPRTVKNQLSNAMKILRTKIGTYCLIVIAFLFFQS
jgi:RNA polymerase sigma-70 factor (ECF subfamily)